MIIQTHQTNMIAALTLNRMIGRWPTATCSAESSARDKPEVPMLVLPEELTEC